MIQRKQTLFLLQLVFLGIALMFIPTSVIVKPSQNVNVYLVLSDDTFVSTAWHQILIGINFLCLLLSCISIFLYKKRTLQLKLCYTIAALYTLLTLVAAFCPLVQPGGEVTEIQNTFIGLIVGLFAILAAFLAARFIKKDIELLKSADRIR